MQIQYWVIMISCPTFSLLIAYRFFIHANTVLSDNDILSCFHNIFFGLFLLLLKEFSSVNKYDMLVILIAGN